MSRRVLVVFDGRADIPWLKIFKPGFRHCFAAVQDDYAWILYSPIAAETRIKIVAPPDYDLRAFYEGEGYTVVKTQVRRPERPAAPLGPFTCVEACKRLLGIHARRVVTPWQLYRYLTEGAER